MRLSETCEGLPVYCCLHRQRPPLSHSARRRRPLLPFGIFSKALPLPTFQQHCDDRHEAQVPTGQRSSTHTSNEKRCRYVLGRPPTFQQHCDDRHAAQVPTGQRSSTHTSNVRLRSLQIQTSSPLLPARTNDEYRKQQASRATSGTTSTSILTYNSF